MNRETVDRAWESGAQQQHADYRPRTGGGQARPQGQRNGSWNNTPNRQGYSSQDGRGGSRPYNNNRQENFRDNRPGNYRDDRDRRDTQGILIDNLVRLMTIVRRVLLMDKRDAMLVDNALMIGVVHLTGQTAETVMTASHSRIEATSDVISDVMIVRRLAIPTVQVHNVKHRILVGKVALANNVMPHEISNMSSTVAQTMVNVSRAITNTLKSVTHVLRVP